MRCRERLQTSFPVHRSVLIIISVLLIGGPYAQAQQTVTSATLSGRVEDAGGAVVRGATLTVTNLDTNQTQTATTDNDGRYRFPYLQVGSYKLSVEANGFSPLAKELTLTVGQALDLPLRLDRNRAHPGHRNDSARRNQRIATQRT
jgi:hypothetical protein